MSSDQSSLTLEELDVDGAIRETASAVDEHTRGAFLRKAGVFGGSILAAGGALGAAPGLAAAKGGGANADVKILNYALTLEYLEASFYKHALAEAGLHGHEYTLANVVHRHEEHHVEFLRKALGSRAISEPKFGFGAATRHKHEFVETAFALENVGVAAYAGQGPRIKGEAYVKAALSILTIEARHASAWALIQGRIGGKKGISPDGSFDKPQTMSKVLHEVSALKFIK